LIQRAKKIGASYNLVPDIELGNLEDTDLGEDQYDVAICSNVFEHVELWREGIQKITRALKPGGLLFLNRPINSVLPRVNIRLFLSMVFMGGCRIGSATNIGWRCKGPTS
jgi:2-polyprenyl-3-methyl-5-hydroxy-6-metoxy-1,4-benzoquinol methylase